ncbi:MAG: glutaminase A, partial [Thermodesulfobacteriota bacterium]
MEVYYMMRPKSLKIVSLSPIVLLLSLLLLGGCASNQSTVSPSPQSLVATEAKAPTAAQSQFSDEAIEAAISNAHANHRYNQDGKNADYIKALADVDSALFGITVVTADGRVFDIGDTESKFSIQSISKVFTYARVMQEHGPQAVKEKLGVNATGLPFNSILAVELIPARNVNPFVNAGAISSTSLVTAADSDARWEVIKKNMDDFAGHELEFNEVVYDSEVNDNLRNQAISKLLQAYGRTYSNPLEATTVYTRQCSVNVTSHDLAVMGSVLANGGVNPVTGKQVIDAANTPYILAVMATAGLYDSAGEWLFE